jgi:hypothetical protein
MPKSFGASRSRRIANRPLAQTLWRAPTRWIAMALTQNQSALANLRVCRSTNGVMCTNWLAIPRDVTIDDRAQHGCGTQFAERITCCISVRSLLKATGLRSPTHAHGRSTLATSACLGCIDAFYGDSHVSRCVVRVGERVCWVSWAATAPEIGLHECDDGLASAQRGGVTVFGELVAASHQR